MRFILTVATALVLGTSGAQAANVAVQSQAGSGHFNGVFQASLGDSLNESDTAQQGKDQLALTAQGTAGGRNLAVIRQRGQQTNAAITLQGSLLGVNEALVIQDGRNNLALTGQLAINGYNGSATSQVGNRNLAVTGQLAVNGGSNFSSTSQNGHDQQSVVVQLAF